VFRENPLTCTNAQQLSNSGQEPADALENPSERHSNRDVVDGISTASVRSTYPGGRRRLPKRMNHAAQILNRL